MAIQIFKICRDQITMTIFRANVREYMKSTRSWRYLVTTSAKETFVRIHLCVCVLTVCTVKQCDRRHSDETVEVDNIFLCRNQCIKVSPLLQHY